MLKYFFSVIFAITLLTPSWSQRVDLQDIWETYKFYDRGIQSFIWYKNDSAYLSIEKKGPQEFQIVETSTKTLNQSVLWTAPSSIPLEEITLDPKEQTILIKSEMESLYRRSYKSRLFTLSPKTGHVDTISTNKVFNPSFSPNGQRIAYTRDNNLWTYNLATKKETQQTFDGKWNHIINGRTDWVYEEEFEFTKAYQWLSDSLIAYLKFDEETVKNFSINYVSDSSYPTTHTYKYPKVGEDNSKISLHLLNVKRHSSETIIESGKAEYIARILPSNQANQLAITTLNRKQNELNLIAIDATTLSLDTLYQEEDKRYIELNNNPFFMGENLYVTSEESGFNHLYKVDQNGKSQITSGQWEIDEICGYNDSLIFFTSTSHSPITRMLWKLNVNTLKQTKLSKEIGTHKAMLSKRGNYLLSTFSSFTQPKKIDLIDINGEHIHSFRDNSNIYSELTHLDYSTPTLFNFNNRKGDQINGYAIYPKDFKKNKKYPVLVYVYGGPGYQTVTNSWDSFNRLWFQHLASKGYIIVSIDGRGTGGRGEEFKKQTYGQLGKYETEDVIDLGNYLKGLKFVDGNRLGIWGWSFGGYLTSLGMVKGDGLFKTGIAVAPVTNWKFYDNIYTERYMGLLTENEKGYEDNSPYNFADQLKGKLLLIHGSADDNVHYQNTLIFQNKLIEANKQFDSFIYPNKDHGIYGGNTRFHLYHLMTNYLLDNL